MNEKTFAPGEFIGCIGWKMEGELSIEFRDTRGEYVGAPLIPCPVGTGTHMYDYGFAGTYQKLSAFAISLQTLSATDLPPIFFEWYF